MSSKTLGALIRIAVIFMGLCGIAICAYFLPSAAGGGSIINPDSMDYEKFGRTIPWLIFSWVAALPCFAILGLAWKVAEAVEEEAVFTVKVAKWIKAAAMLIFIDCALFFAVSAIFAVLQMSEPSIAMMSIMVTMFGVSIGIAAATLSRYVTKAARLQEEVNGTL
jgi:hypothetical protein